MTIRSLRRTRFAPRPKYTTSICTLIALIMSVLTWLSTRLRMPRNKCFGDMIWRSIRSAPLGVVICSFLIPSFIMMAAIIALQLHRTVNVDPNERVAGTRMVYYLLLSAVLYVSIDQPPLQIISANKSLDSGPSLLGTSSAILIRQGSFFFTSCRIYSLHLRGCGRIHSPVSESKRGSYCYQTKRYTLARVKRAQTIRPQRLGTDANQLPHHKARISTRRKSFGLVDKHR